MSIGSITYSQVVTFTLAHKPVTNISPDSPNLRAALIRRKPNFPTTSGNGVG